MKWWSLIAISLLLLILVVNLIEQANIILALTSNDEDNLVACQIAQQHFGVDRAIALVNDPALKAFFEQMGITVAFSVTQILADLIEKRSDFEDIASSLTEKLKGIVSMPCIVG